MSQYISHLLDAFLSKLHSCSSWPKCNSLLCQLQTLKLNTSHKSSSYVPATFMFAPKWHSWHIKFNPKPPKNHKRDFDGHRSATLLPHWVPVKKDLPFDLPTASRNRQYRLQLGSRPATYCTANMAEIILSCSHRKWTGRRIMNYDKTPALT